MWWHIIQKKCCTANLWSLKATYIHCDIMYLHIWPSLLSLCFLIGAQTAVTARWCPTCHRRPSEVPRSSPAAMQRDLLNSSEETVRQYPKIFFFPLPISKFQKLTSNELKWMNFDSCQHATRLRETENKRNVPASLTNKKINKGIGLLLWSFFHWVRKLRKKRWFWCLRSGAFMVKL